jgi:hypothetical protein
MCWTVRLNRKHLRGVETVQQVPDNIPGMDDAFGDFHVLQLVLRDNQVRVCGVPPKVVVKSCIEKIQATPKVAPPRKYEQ